MTKKGYTHIIVPKDLHTRLKTLAEAQDISMSSLIKNLLSINTSINTTTYNGSLMLSKINLNQASFQENNNFLVRLPGFEPGLGAWGAPVLDQTGP